MEKINLNQKSWYRLLKVIFIIAFLVTQLFGFSIVSAFTSGTIPYVYCDNGTGFKNDTNPLTGIYDESTRDKTYVGFFRQCDETAYYFNSSNIKGIITDEQYKQLNNLVLKMKSQNVLMESDFQSAVDSFITQHADLSLSPSDFNSIIFPSKNFYIPKAITKSHGFKTFFVGKDGHAWKTNFSQGNKNIYSFAEKSGYYFLSFLMISVLFWLISRIFFYVVVKEKFLKLR